MIQRHGKKQGIVYGGGREQSELFPLLSTFKFYCECLCCITVLFVCVCVKERKQHTRQLIILQTTLTLVTHFFFSPLKPTTDHFVLLWSPLAHIFYMWSYLGFPSNKSLPGHLSTSRGGAHIFVITSKCCLRGPSDGSTNTPKAFIILDTRTGILFGSVKVTD